MMRCTGCSQHKDLHNQRTQLQNQMKCKYSPSKSSHHTVESNCHSYHQSSSAESRKSCGNQNRQVKSSLRSELIHTQNLPMKTLLKKSSTTHHSKQCHPAEMLSIYPGLQTASFLRPHHQYRSSSTHSNSLCSLSHWRHLSLTMCSVLPAFYPSTVFP